MPNHVTNELRIISGSPKRIAAIFKSIINEHGRFDFNKVIPRPDSLNVSEGSVTEALMEALKGNVVHFIKYHYPEIKTGDDVIKHFKSERPKSFERDMLDAAAMVENEKLHGFRSWYGWSASRWGTKWNAYNNNIPVEPPKASTRGAYRKRILNKRVARHIKLGTELVLRFETAWRSPEPIFEELAKRYPDVTFSVTFADEDTGSNCGQYHIKGNEYPFFDVAPPYRVQSDDEKRRWTKFAFQLCRPETDPLSYGYDENWNYIEED
ncbi:TPA: hypothetical protein ACPZJO_003307 [Yersinia enterocolitica]